MFTFINTIFAILALIIDKGDGTASPEMDSGMFYSLFSLAIFIPQIAVTVRRLHDVGQSGWMVMIGLIPCIGGIWLLIETAKDSQQGNNKWGDNPKDIAA